MKNKGIHYFQAMLFNGKRHLNVLLMPKFRIMVYLPLLLAFLSFDLRAQKRVQYDLYDFDGIKVSGGINVYLAQGDHESVEIETSKGSFDNLVVEIDEDHNLLLGLKPQRRSWFTGFEEINAYITFVHLDRIHASGGSDVFGSGELSFDNVNISVSGGSDLKIKINANELYLNCSGGSDTFLEGYAAFFKGTASGGSDIKAEKLSTEVCNIKASGGSDARVRVNEEISGSANGGSDVYYYGSPKVVNVSSSGGSDVRRRE